MVTLMQLADDTIFFFSNDVGSFSMVSSFENIYSLKINLLKSGLVDIALETNTVANFSSLVACGLLGFVSSMCPSWWNPQIDCSWDSVLQKV